MLEAFHERLGDRVDIAGENAGVHMVVWLRDVSADALDGLIVRAADRGLGIYSVAPYYIDPPTRAGLLLGYAGLTIDEIREGVRRLADLIARASP